MNSFPSGWNMPSTFGDNYGSFPSAWYPSTFGANHGSFPSAWNPSTFGGNHSSWTDNRFNSCIRDAVFRPASMAEFLTFSTPIHVNAFDGSRMLNLCFDVKGFKAEECKVEFSPKERCITVEAKCEVKDKEHTVTRNYLRKYIVPTEFCADLTKCELKCHLTFDGQLVIEGFLPKMTAEELKALKEKTPSKLSHMTGAFCPAGFSSVESTFGCAIPIKMN
jgi:HSP20 family molecular chaperone IbpA